MYYGSINVNKVLSNKSKISTIVNESAVETPETDKQIREQWLNDICDKYTPVSIFEASISDKLDKMIDTIITNPLNISEYNKLLTKIRLDKIKLSASNVRKLLKFNTELILNPEVKLVDKKSVENVVNLPILLCKEAVDTGNKATIAVYKKILETHKIGLDAIKDADKDLLKAFNKSIKDAISLLDKTNVKESFNSIGNAYDNSISGTYAEKLFELEYQTVNLFTSDEDITLEQFQDYIRTAVALESMEISMEAGKITNASRKITNKVQAGVRRLDQKTSGKRETVGKNINRIDKTLSGIINKKIDDIINTSRDSKREKLITGRTSIKLGKLMKNTIKTLIAGSSANIVFGPVGGTLATIVGILGTYACSKRTEMREKKRILLELETEHKIVSEKIEDAKGENDRKQKYELMRVQAKLEKEITRIKYNMRYY